MSRPDDAYLEQVGAEALERQQAASRAQWVCCGEPKGDGDRGPGPSHHPLCRLYEAPDVPEHIDGQESLL